VRPCDVRSLERLDRVFLSEPADSLYREARENTTIIALGCTEPGKNCFCDAMGGSPNAAPGADLFLTDAGEAYGLRAQSPRGEAVLEAWQALLSEGEAPAGRAACALRPPAEGLAVKLEARFDDPLFAELSRACLGCGTCSFVCPTCYCFDLGDETQGASGVKFRCWDSCMFSDYTRMAGGADPRPTKKERLRNRYLHKLCYFNQQHGESLCVGCGRCIDQCPAHLDITDLIFRMGGDGACEK
ncbi:MAG: 4Fe-4S dicluster domain-containing protein, partial [Clostridia bacterium]|nr:4Fe-4S dicluster domain-containing protein [Clostridia bacterium]